MAFMLAASVIGRTVHKTLGGTIPGAGGKPPPLCICSRVPRSYMQLYLRCYVRESTEELWHPLGDLAPCADFSQLSLHQQVSVR
jgi:hypothetical protein